ncbi:lymphatic vessel endothelial hyaluronic acid receptor 1 [Anolis carolinensis]|uniref:lymphatic vessel endothelial hyaluronic acid receptor 1 n=1 Tax=Anolis carolinensis TaxID=28377 RepID=UPI002F2B2E94
MCMFSESALSPVFQIVLYGFVGCHVFPDSDLDQGMAFELDNNFVPSCKIGSGISAALKKGPHSNFTRCGSASLYQHSRLGSSRTWISLVSLIMAFRFGITFFFFSVWIINLTIQGTFLSKDIYTSKCRIAGITLVSYKNQANFNFTEAQQVCRQLDLMLAHNSEVEKAWKHGFETCSFGWVAERYAVISRIIPNEKCGQNKTGVAIWRLPVNRKARAYCYNSSDTWVNSCIPEATTLALPDVSTEMNSTSTFLPQDTSAIVQTSEPPQTKGLQKLYRVKCVTEIITPKPTTEEEIVLSPDKRTAFKNDGIQFGGVPIALLVLALIFFVASVVLAVCYIKKYKKTFPFSKKNEKKEEIETKNVKQTKTSNKSPQEEPKNRKKAAEPQSKPEPPVKCLEAEV